MLRLFGYRSKRRLDLPSTVIRRVRMGNYVQTLRSKVGWRGGLIAAAFIFLLVVFSARNSSLEDSARDEIASDAADNANANQVAVTQRQKSDGDSSRRRSVTADAKIVRAPDGRPKKLMWTQKPVRVDPNAQDLPRLEAILRIKEFPKVLQVSRFVRVIDSTTFLVDKKHYRLAHIRPIPPKQLCIDLQARRWACGVRARVALRRLIAGRIFLCRKFDPNGRLTVEVDCRLTDTQTLSEYMTAKGWATPKLDAPKSISMARFQAEKNRIGVFATSVSR